MPNPKILFLSIPKAGKTDTINCLIELQKAVIDSGMYPGLQSAHTDLDQNQGRNRSVFLNHTVYDLIEYGKEGIAPDLGDALGLVIIIPSNDIYAERSKHIWNWAITTDLPCIAFVNKLDLIMHAPKYMNKINRGINNSQPVNQKYLYDFLHYKVTKKSNVTYHLTKQTYPLLFGSAVSRIGIFDLFKTMGQYFSG